MKQNKTRFGRTIFLALSLAGLAQGTLAQTFTYNVADLCLGFRKTGDYQENNEVVVDIGQASGYVGLSIGTTIAVPNFSPSQLSPGSFTSLNNLQWSVTGYTVTGTYPNYPKDTLWVTVPRSSANVQSTPPTRLRTSNQQTIVPEIEGIFLGAQRVSIGVGVSNQFNTPFFEQESIVNYPDYILTDFMGGINDPTEGTLQDTWPEDNLEITTPNAFSGSVRSDLYEVRPLTDAQGHPIVDPHTGTNGPAYFVGYFQFNSNGTMTFTRAASSTNSAPPPPPTLVIARINSTATISFGTTNGATYTLYFTNSAGLRQPVANWPSSPTTIIGDGTTKQFVDPLTSANRFYQVGAH
ncbi:exported hypothetical protein [Verrucomicrobia bacterium]|nr:exported hypothetical protein [Verrucomicrobiota bacterium]